MMHFTYLITVLLGGGSLHVLGPTTAPDLDKIV